MKRALLYVAAIVSLLAGAWGYAYELAYFGYLKMNVHDILGPKHFIYTGLANIGPMLGILLALSLVMKFFSKNLTRDDMKVIGERLAAAKFSEELVMARVGFLLSLVFMLLVLFDVRFGREMGIGYMFWLFTYFNIQFFFGSLCLSPPQSKVAIVFAFVLSVAMCFVAGGVDHARMSSKSQSDLRDDGVVKVRRDGNQIVAEPKAIDLPLPIPQKVKAWLATLL